MEIFSILIRLIHLATGLALNRSIRQLRIDGNLLQEAGGRELLELLRGEQPPCALETVYFETDNSISGELIDDIRRALEKRRRE